MLDILIGAACYWWGNKNGQQTGKQEAVREITNVLQQQEIELLKRQVQDLQKIRIKEMKISSE